MSELKYYKLFHRTSALTSPAFISIVEFGHGDEVYLKSEADKVIAEKDKEIAELKDKLQNVSSLLKETREWLIESQKMHKRCADNAIKKIRHHKFKRCLAMAKWCEAENYTECWYHENSERCKWTEKWHRRWLELAKKFKPNKSTAQQGKGNKMNEANENPMSKCVRSISRTNSDVVSELSYERREVSNLLAKLNKAIEADPEAVSAHHKELWRKQAKAMQEYVDVLGERIKDLIDNG